MGNEIKETYQMTPKPQINPYSYEELEEENDQLTNRYIEAEKFIMDINELSWFQRLFVLPYMVTDYLKHVLKIYKF